MLLVDTNVFPEVLLEQENSKTAEEFPLKTPPELIHVSDFTLYSKFFKLTEDVLINAGFTLLRLPPLEFKGAIRAIERFNLDFDDAYQYHLAELYNLRIVSFDSDFDKTERGRVTPRDALKLVETHESGRNQR